MSDRIWALQYPQPFRGSHLAQWSRKMSTGEKLVCPVNPEHNRGIVSSTLSLVVGRQPTDFQWSWSYDLSCSARVREAIESAGLTGLRFDPAEVERRPKSAEQPGQYFWVRATGWGGLPPPEAGMKLLSSCPGCKHRRYLIADPSKIVTRGALDGSDFFFVWPAQTMFCNERAAEWIRTAGFSGIGLVEAHSVEYGGHKFGPLPLSDLIGAERARRVGEPLGIYD